MCAMVCQNRVPDVRVRWNFPSPPVEKFATYRTCTLIQELLLVGDCVLVCVWSDCWGGWRLAITVCGLWARSSAAAFGVGGEEAAVRLRWHNFGVVCCLVLVVDNYYDDGAQRQSQCAKEGKII